MKNLLLITLCLALCSCWEDADMDRSERPVQVLASTQTTHTGSSEAYITRYTYDDLGRPDSVISRDVINVKQYDESGLIMVDEYHYLNDEGEIQDSQSTTYTYENELIVSEGSSIDYLYQNQICTLKRETRPGLILETFYTFEDGNYTEELVQSVFQDSIADAYTLRYTFEAMHNPYADIAYYYRGLPNSRDNPLSVARVEGGVVQEPYLRYEHEYDNLGNLISSTELVRQLDDSWEASYTRAYFYTYLD